MKIRLMGTAEECTAAVEAIRGSQDIDVLDVSAAHPNRGESRLVRVYVEARVSERAERDRALYEEGKEFHGLLWRRAARRDGWDVEWTDADDVRLRELGRRAMERTKRKDTDR